MKKNILFFILGAIIFSGVTAVALSIDSKDVAYSNSTSGSTATNVQDAIDELYENGGGKIDLLWTNPTPTGEFPAQTVSLDLSGYEAVLIKCTTDAGHYGSDIGVVGTANLIQYVEVGRNIPSLGFGAYLRSALDPVMTYRSVNVTETGVIFGDGYGNTKNTTGGSNNSFSLPIRIWGVKKALEG